jgi:hypothetical protein
VVWLLLLEEFIDDRLDQGFAGLSRGVVTAA